ERYEELRYQAERRGMSVASIVREAVAQYLGHAEAAAAMRFGEDPVDGLAGSIGGGPDDDSVNHDRYLYGWPNEEAHEAAGRHRSAPRAHVEKRPASSGRAEVRAGAAERKVRHQQSDPGRGGDTHSGPRRRPTRRGHRS